MQATLRRYVDFGLELLQTSTTTLMFTWHVPEIQRLPGHAPGARGQDRARDLPAGHEPHHQGHSRSAAGEGPLPSTEEDAGFLLVYYWSTCHGYIAGFNNTLLTYMHENPILQ
ncbi:MAG: hypothetical protein MZV70_42355 [Desulfobacterales bacterium]|nr:hypothetical protein [Desulfobacterales bacterium]